MLSIELKQASFIVCLLCSVATAAPFNTGQANQYPRTMSTGKGDNEIFALDAHFPSDTMVFAGRSKDAVFKADTDSYNPIVAAISID
jgi:hypothetical protein